MMHGCGLTARCILRVHPSRSLARGHPSHLTLTDSSHQPQRRSPSGHQPRQIISHRRTFPPKFRNQFSAARDSSQQLSSSAASIRSQLAQVPSHEYGDVARVSAPAAARRPGRRRSAGSPRTHSCRCGTTTGLPQHSAALTLMFLEIHNVRVSSD